MSSRPATETKMSAVMVKDGLGKIDLALRFNVADIDQCYLLFSLKPQKKKGRRNTEPAKQSLEVTDPSIIQRGNGEFVIPFYAIEAVSPLNTGPSHRFMLRTKSKTAHIFVTSKKLKKKWMNTLRDTLNQFKIKHDVGARGTRRTQGGTFSNTMQFRGRQGSSLTRNDLMASYGTIPESSNFSNMRMGSNRSGSARIGSGRDLDVYKSPKLKKTLRGKEAVKMLNNQSKFQAIKKDFANPVLPKLEMKPFNDDVEPEITLTTEKRISIPKVEMLSILSSEKVAARMQGKPPPPPGGPPTKSTITTYARPMTKINVMKNEEIVSLNRGVVMPVLADENEHLRDYGKTASDLDFLRDALKSSHAFQTVLFKNFDDQAMEEVVEKMFKEHFVEEERIIEKGEMSRYLYVLEKGVFVQSIPGTNESVKRAAASSSFGELQLKYGSSSTFTVVCLKPCRFWVLSRIDYLAIAAENSNRIRILRMEALKAVPAFKRVLTARGLSTLAASLDMHFASKGDIVLKAFDEITDVILVTQGQINLYGETDIFPRVKITQREHFGILALFEPVVSKFRLVVGSNKTVYFTLNITEFNESFGDFRSFLEATIMQDERQKNKTQMVLSKPVSIQQTVSSLRETMSHLISLPAVKSQMPIPSIRSLAIEDVLTDAYSEMDTSIDEEDEYDFPFLESPPLLPSIKYSDLEVLNAINAGNFGQVYTVRYRGYQNPKSKALKLTSSSEPGEYAFPDYAPVGFALKLMPRQRISRNGWQDKVDNEIMAMAEVSFYCRTPFIIQLYHSFCCPKFIHLLIELGEGGDLYHLVRGQRNHCFNERSARYYIACVVNGLDVLHQRRILYRDLKPENLILNNKGHLKVADLGLAKKTTRTYTQCGTPEYTAPEVIENVGHDHACDWWAVGVLVFELHYGETPFFAPGSTQIYDNIEAHRSPIRFYDQRNPPARISKKRFGMLKGKNHFSRDCKDLIAKFLIPKPGLRLGYVKPGAQKVRNHPYFKNHSSFSWERLAQLKEVPPFVIDLPEEEQIENLEQDPDVRYMKDKHKDQSRWEPKVNTILRSTPPMKT